MYNISINFNNEAISTFEDIIEVSSSFNINNIEIGDSIDNTDIISLCGADLENYRNVLVSSFKKIVLLNTNKSVYDETYYRKLFRQAHLLNVESIALSMSENEVSNSLIVAIRAIVAIGKSYDIGVLFENNSKSFIRADKTLTEFYRQIKDDNTGVIFNPLQYSIMKSHPFFHEYYNSKLKKEIKVLRINDALFTDGSPVLPGKGNAELKEMVSILISIGFKGYYSIVPYFKDMNLDIYNDVIVGLKNIFMTI